MHGDVDHFHDLWLRASSPAGVLDGGGPRIAGRRRELARTRGHLGTGTGLLLVAGEAGMGKTRLVATAAALESGALFVGSGSCLPLSTEVPFLPVADVLRAIHAIDDHTWLTDALGRCPPFVSSSLGRLLPELGEPGDEPQSSDGWLRQRLFTSIEAVLVELHATRPLAVLVEDLHWADSATLDLLEHLLARGTDVPVLGTWRLDDPATTPASRDWFTRVSRLPSVGVLELSPLTRDETQEQLSLLLPGPPDNDLVDRVHRRAQGHPLFIDQLAADPTGVGDMPRLLVDLLDTKLQGLTPTAWAVARALGVADRPLLESQVGAVAELTNDGLVSAERELADRRLLSEPFTSNKVSLRHPLLAETVRRHLFASEAADQHRRIASVLAEGPDPAAAEIATHWQAVGDTTRELEWRIRAAREAEARVATANAAEQWLRVLELWPPGAASAGSPPLRRWPALAAACDALGESDRILEHEIGLLESALEWAPTLRPEEAAELYARVGGNRSFHGDPTGPALMDRAIDLYEHLPPSPGYVRALMERAGTRAERGRVDEAARDLATGVEVSVAIGDRLQGRKLRVMQAGNDFVLGDRAGALARMATLTISDPTTPDPHGDIHAAGFFTDLLLTVGADPDEVEEAARPGLEAARTWHIASFPESILRFNVAEAAWRAGQTARAAAGIDPETDVPVSHDRWLLRLARIRLDAMRGDSTAAVRLTDVDRLPATLHAWCVPHAALVELWCQQPERALARLTAHLDREIAAGETQPDEAIFALTARAAADVAGSTPASGRRRRAEALASSLEERRSTTAELPPDPYSAVDASRHATSATYAAEMDRLADRQTVEAWVRAAREWDKVNRPHDAAYCRWRAAHVALATGRATTAASLLNQAARQAREHAPLLEAIASLRRRSARSPQG
ncbi:ATP-binding protein [Nocardioides pini]|nr:AAA family ATPase [Nocardioides pini]